MNKVMLEAYAAEIKRGYSVERFSSRYNSMQERITEGFHESMGRFVAQRPDVNQTAFRHHYVSAYSPRAAEYSLPVEWEGISPARLIAFAKDPSKSNRFTPYAEMDGRTYAYVCESGTKNALKTFMRATGVGRTPKGNYQLLDATHEMSSILSSEFILKDGSFESHLNIPATIGNARNIVTIEEFDKLPQSLLEYIKKRNLFEMVFTRTVTDMMMLLEISDSVTAVESNWPMLFSRFFSTQGVGKKKKYSPKQLSWVRITFDLSTVIRMSLPLSILDEHTEFGVISREEMVSNGLDLVSNIVKVPTIYKVVKNEF